MAYSFVQVQDLYVDGVQKSGIVKLMGSDGARSFLNPRIYQVEVENNIVSVQTRKYYEYGERIQILLSPHNTRNNLAGTYKGDLLGIIFNRNRAFSDFLVLIVMIITVPVFVRIVIFSLKKRV